jgi:type IV fimbrial biogenesis protein FimT
MHTLPKSRGFTLIELMFAIFIGAILIMIAVPSFRSTIASNRLAAQTNELIGAINFARSEAITRNANQQFCRTNTEAANVCSGGAGNWNFWIVRNTVTNEIARRGAINTFGGNIVVRTTLPTDTIVFSSDGLARLSAGGTIVNHNFVVCTTMNNVGNNRRVLAVGSASRTSTTRSTGTCP